MIAFTDVQYDANLANAACVCAPDWSAATASAEWSVTISPVAEYEPGAFYKRELPCLLRLLESRPRPDCIVIDGYVWLDDEQTPGLGAHLHRALGSGTPVVGIAKTAYRGSSMAAHVLRPSSKKPLFVTSVGLDRDLVARCVAEMAGPARIPALLQRVDWLARGRPPTP